MDAEQSQNRRKVKKKENINLKKLFKFGTRKLLATFEKRVLVEP